MEITNIARCAFMTPDPKLLTVDFADLAQRAAQTRADRDAAAPPPGKADLRKEYNDLRQRLFNLKQDAKTFEIRTNESAGRIRLIEERIDNLLRLKKEAAEMGNLRGERTYEQSLERLETELGDAQEEFSKNKAWNTQATRALKAFDGHGRIEELRLLLETPSSEAKK
jgi:hypothetical protein